MMCDECGIRPVNFHITTIAAGERKERNLCVVCFAKYQKQLPGMDLGNFAGILSGILEAGKGENAEQESEETKTLRCDRCGMTYTEFKRSGRLGCAQCYTAFHAPLEALISRIHGNTQHAGRIPGEARNSASIRMSIERLRRQLGQAISDEAYEEAAQLRDRIRALTSQLEEGEANNAE